ncbi:3'-5' exonuclease family protein [Legionella hackeliae]|uniref:Excinuclease cho n=2 Tax=Legionella hackeliae TaxID=449 RepID=A0A0A8UTR9_LEGHA|nr:3'-5' exonuclease family protein [Legionella hackeliae]KTD14082.1 excinuclease ABC subunit C [Legionella hackeliae]CEK10124.1 DNA polymerase III, epsilon subunit [Legionella hackeliae]STX46847.1 excinuclease ABC subunit C [Legionella hackeliae]
MQFRWALIDIETTGLKVTRDEIIEIALIILSEKGIEKTWATLVNPQTTIPEEITRITGITQQEIISALPFEAIASDLFDLLNGCILVAHNARFDYGFLKNAFKRCGYRYQTKVLCTLKLARSCYPLLPHHDLSSLLLHLNLPHEQRHRAASDVQLLYAFLQRAMDEFSPSKLLEKAKAIYNESSKPSKLITDLNTIPSQPGVYLFYTDKNDLPIYIGKSINLKQRVLSHFQADYSDEKEFKMAQQVHRVEYIETAGELSALLLESKLVKEKLPLFNRKLRRKKNLVGLKITTKDSYNQLLITTNPIEVDHDDCVASFSTVTAAKSTLRSLVKEHVLCAKLCDLEKSNSSCFAYHLRRCHGACVAEEEPHRYNERLAHALQQFSYFAWPYQGPIAIEERSNFTNYLVFNHWCFLGETSSKEELFNLANKKESQRIDRDTYKILNAFLKDPSNQLKIIDLSNRLNL